MVNYFIGISFSLCPIKTSADFTAIFSVQLADLHSEKLAERTDKFDFCFAVQPSNPMTTMPALRKSVLGYRIS